MNFKISACIITLNEEANLVNCLESLSFVDEIIIIDSGSVDKTIEIANRYNASVYYREFDNYVNQKNYSLSKAKNQWVLSLDADEAVSKELKTEIESLTSPDLAIASGYQVPRLTFYLGKWIRHGGWYPNFQVRLFKKDKGFFKGFLVHEKVELVGELKSFQSPILHYSYRDISHHLHFIDKYSSLTAREKFSMGKRSGVVFSIVKGMWKFFYMYLVRFGFLDGRPGLVIAVLGAYYNFLKYIKLYELEIRSQKSYTLSYPVMDTQNKVSNIHESL
jgi:glycosyltransferase involved in cell wall biosynthesis